MCGILSFKINFFRQISQLGSYRTEPPTGTLKWSKNIKITIKKADDCKQPATPTSEETTKTEGSTKVTSTNVPGIDQGEILIGAAGGVCLIVLIILIVVCYCKVVKKKENTEKEEEVKHENPVYNAWVYDVADDNYVKDVNNCYDQ